MSWKGDLLQGVFAILSFIFSLRAPTSTRTPAPET
jgi:hypothetical protein